MTINKSIGELTTLDGSLDKTLKASEQLKDLPQILQKYMLLGNYQIGNAKKFDSHSIFNDIGSIDGFIAQFVNLDEAQQKAFLSLSSFDEGLEDYIENTKNAVQIGEKFNSQLFEQIASQKDGITTGVLNEFMKAGGLKDAKGVLALPNTQDAIALMEDYANHCSDASKTQQLFNAGILEQENGVYKLSQAFLKEISVKQASTVATVALTAAQKAWNVVAQYGKQLLLSLGVAAVAFIATKIVDYLMNLKTHSEELVATMNDSHDAAEQATKDVEEIQSKIDELNKSLKDAGVKKIEDIVDPAERERLQAINDMLQAQLELKKQLEKDANDKANADTSAVVNDKTEDSIVKSRTVNVSYAEGGANAGTHQVAEKVSKTESLHEYAAALEDTTQKRRDLQVELDQIEASSGKDSEEYANKKKELDALNETFESQKTQVEELSTAVSEQMGNYKTDADSFAQYKDEYVAGTNAMTAATKALANAQDNTGIDTTNLDIFSEKIKQIKNDIDNGDSQQSDWKTFNGLDAFSGMSGEAIINIDKDSSHQTETETAALEKLHKTADENKISFESLIGVFESFGLVQISNSAAADDYADKLEKTMGVIDNADIRSYIEVIFNAACDAVQRDGSTLQSKILELDSFGVDCMIYGKTVRVKNMIAAVEGGIAAGRILSAADVAAIAGCTKEELDKYFHDTSVFVGYSMHDIQGTIWELKDGLTQIYNFYHALYSGEAEIRTGTNFVDTDGVHWYGAGVYAIQQNGYSYDATTNKLSLSCLDMTCLLDGTLGGTLTGYATRIPMYDRKLVVKDGVNYYEDDKKKPHYVRDSIKETFELSGLTKSMVDYWVRRIPHDLEYNTGTTIWNILTELRDLYFPFEMYFDDDTFVCKEIPSGYDDPVVLDEDTFKSMVISEDASVDYGQIHNCVEVWGASNSSDYFCKDKLEKNDPDGTGEVVYCKKGTKEWNDVVTLLKDNKLNMSYNMNPNDTGASILLLKLKQASIQDGTRFSFICPEDIAINARICVENLVTTIKTNPTGAGQYRETTRAVYGPMMLFKAVTNEKGEDEPEDTSLLRKGRYYVIKYGEHWLNQATDGAFTYKFNALTGKYEKEQRDPQVRYYPKQIYNPSTKNYDTVYVKYNPATNTEIQISDPALLIESRVYFIGQSQSHAMTKFVDAMPTAKQIEADKIAEACDNLEYVVVNDPNRIDDLYNSRLTIDKIGRRNLVCSGSEFDGYTSDESAMTVCKYTLWKNCRLTDSITLSMHMIPWLDVNEKVKYAAKYLKSDIAVEWIIKKIDKNIGEGTMNVTLSRYYPYYPP